MPLFQTCIKQPLDFRHIHGQNIHDVNDFHNNYNQQIFIIGVDEVGRGPLLGDVVISAVIFPNEILQNLSEDNLAQAENVSIIANHELSLLTDSKKLTEKKREILFPIIQQQALAWNIIKIPPAVIDELNIFQATMFGMKQAINAIITSVNQAVGHNFVKFSVMVDGNKLPKLDDLATMTQIYHQQAIVKGDSKHASISGASVLAKVSRDHDMYELANIYPKYAIDKHKGYPTVAHLQAIEKYGILPEHRKSFSPIKQLIKA